MQPSSATTPTLPAAQRRAPSLPPKNAPNRLSAANLGERVSILYSIAGDPEHPFSEVTGVVMRVVEAGDRNAYHIVRRTGEVVEVNAAAVIKMKLMPPGISPLRMPASWDDAGS